jgi:hypothetical protein
VATFTAAFANHLSLITRRHLCLQSTFWAGDDFRHARLNYQAFLTARKGKAEPRAGGGAQLLRVAQIPSSPAL